MFDKFKGAMDQYQAMQKLMKDDNFKTFIANPKVQELFKDAEFQLVAKTKDFAKILAHPKFVELMRDTELAELMLKIDPKRFL